MLLDDNDPKYRAYAVICHHCPHNERSQIPSGPIPQFCKCTVNGKAFLDNARAGECPKGLYVLPTDFVAQPTIRGVGVSTLTRMQRDGPALWREIHTREAPDAAWFATIATRLPCGSCKADWLAYVATNPPDFGAGWFAWTVSAHNAVNARLNDAAVNGMVDRPIMTEAEARARWA